MKKRNYQKPADVALLQEFNAQQSKRTNGCGYSHSGDIFYHIYSGNKGFDPAEILTIWEDNNGVAAWMLASPGRKEFEVYVGQDQSDGFEQEVLTYGEQRTLELMKLHRIESDTLSCDVFSGDHKRRKLLLEMGWQIECEAEYVYNKMSLTDLPNRFLPAGYRIRPVKGLGEAARVAEVHNGSFGSNWTEAEYLRMMIAPGYQHELEFVVETEDGDFAGFTLTWHDPITSSGFLEPVGVHRDHRRKGLGRALVYHAVHHMKASGLAYGIVMNETANEGALNLYRSCGFKPWQPLDTFSKMIV